MKLSDKKANLILALIIVISLCISTCFMLTKQGYHEDELLTYNLANSSKQLNTEGWNSPEDFNEYLAVSDAHRFDYAQVYQNQPLVIVNESGSATPEDIIGLERQIISAVRDRFAVTLHPEVEHV